MPAAGRARNQAPRIATAARAVPLRIVATVHLVAGVRRAGMVIPALAASASEIARTTQTMMTTTGVGAVFAGHPLSAGAPGAVVGAPTSVGDPMVTARTEASQARATTRINATARVLIE